MSRPIKFRAWDKVEGHYWNDLLNLGTAGRPEFDCADEYFDCDEFIIEQYTGLKDKNGKEIYEGDIVKCRFYCITSVVEYDESCAMFRVKEYWDTPLGEWDEKNLEVIGNIHESPELLGGEK